MKINNNICAVSDLTMKGTDVFKNEEVVLKDVRLNHRYEDGKRLEVIESISYDCVDPVTFDTFVVKVPSSVPVIDPAQLENSDEPVFAVLPLDKVVVRPYKIEFGKASLSITSPSISITK